MELRWLEDFLCVLEMGNFSRAAEARYLTQSALSRRVRSLENWVGVELLDRSQQPITATGPGRAFSETARSIVSASYEGRTTAQDLKSRSESSITIACLHTLGLFHMPDLVARLQKDVTEFEASIIVDARTIEEYLDSLLNGTSDFFCCYTYASFPSSLIPGDYDRLAIGSESMVPYQSAHIPRFDLSGGSHKPIPYLAYAGTTFMSRVVDEIAAKAQFRHRLKRVYSSPLAESLAMAAIKGLGIVWLPVAIASSHVKAGDLVPISEEYQATMGIEIYRSTHNKRPIEQQIWNHMEKRVRQGEGILGH